MGTFFSPIGTTRKQLIAELVGDNEFLRTIRYCLRGNCLWSVVETTTNKQYIKLDLLVKHDNCWGYKPMDESYHPYYYSCPLSYLQMTPIVCLEWRARVVCYHMSQTEKRQLAKAK